MFQDLRYGARMLFQHPFFTITAVLTLALGIGANTTIFSVLDAAIIRPLPFAHAERLVAMWHALPDGNFFTGIRYEAFQEWRQQTNLFEYVEGETTRSLLLTGVPEPEFMSVPALTPGTFAMLGVQPQLGRAFLPEEATSGKDQVVLISDEFWKKYFGGEPNVLGKTLTLGNRPYTIVGVMPANFKYPIWSTKYALWTPLAFNPTPENRNKTLKVVARLRAGVARQTAEQALNVLGERLNQEKPDADGIGWKVQLFSPDERYFKERWRPALLALFAAGGFVLLLACLNAANLLLSRAATRQKEIAIRSAVGASRGRLIQQLLTESLMLALIGGAGGVIFALWGVQLTSKLAPSMLQSMSFHEIGVNGRVLAFTLGLSILTGIVFGLMPALRISRLDVNSTLKGAQRGAMGDQAHNRLRSVLIVAEIALSLSLLIGAGLTIRSFLRLSHEPLGFDPENLLTVNIGLPRLRYPTPSHQQEFFDQLKSKIAAVPGVESVTSTSVSSPQPVEIEIEGQPPQPPTTNFMPDFIYAEPNFFEVMHTAILKGRAFSPQDGPNAPPVTIISNEMARRYWPNSDAVGKRLRIGKSSNWVTVIGVAGNLKGYNSAARMMAIYYPFAQAQAGSSFSFRQLRIRATINPTALIPTVKSQVWAIDKDQPISYINVFENLALQEPRFYSALMSVFAAIALLLAAIGTYGVISYLVSQRTHEIGVRMALGAQRSDIFKLIIGRGMMLTLCGIALGIGASLALTRFLSSLIVGISTTDQLTFTVASLLLITIALLACYWPARRAMKVDPMEALRYE